MSVRDTLGQNGRLNKGDVPKALEANATHYSGKGSRVELTIA